MSDGNENFRTTVFGEALTSPVLAGTTVLLSLYKSDEYSSLVTGVDAVSGKELWSFPVDGKLDGHVFAGKNGLLVPLERNRIVWIQ